MNKIIKIIAALGFLVNVYATDIELIQYSDLRLRNANASESLYKTWTLQGSKSESPVTITFEPKQVYGTDGCNRYSAPVQIAGNSLKVGAVMATRTNCDQLKGADTKYHRTLVTVESYRVTEKGTLELLDQSGEIILVFHR